jgi:hypothetical protein
MWCVNPIKVQHVISMRWEGKPKISARHFDEERGEIPFVKRALV